MKDWYMFFRKYYFPRRLKIVFYIMFSIIHKITLWFIPIYTQNLIDVVFLKETTSMLNKYGILLFMILIIFLFSLSSKLFLQDLIENSIQNEMKLNCIKHISEIPYSVFLEKETGYFLQRFNIDIEKVRSIILEIPVMLPINILFVCAMICLMVSLNIHITLFLFFLFPLFFLFSIICLPRIKHYQSCIAKESERINSCLEDNINGNYTLRVNHALSYIESKTKKLLSTLYRFQKKSIFWNMLYESFIINNAMNMALTIIYWYGGYLVLRGEISIGTLMAFSLCFSRLWDATNFIIATPREIKIAKLSLKRYTDFIAIKTEVKSMVNLDDCSCNLIKMDNVSISYNEKIILEKINLCIAQKDKIAIIGENGSGKTTIGNLLLKLIEPSSGEIFYNDINYKSLSSNELTKRINFISADPYLFQTTIKENIIMDVNINNFPSHYLLNEFFVEIKNKWNLDVNKIVTNKGQNLSSGERKLIQIIRGFIKDADVYILDEPLNFVDKEYKDVIISSIDKFYKDKMLLIISHDDSIFSICNKKYKISDKKLIQI